MFRFTVPILFSALILLSINLVAQDTFTVSGVGKAQEESTKKKKEKPLKAQEAMANAERNALKDAVRQAVLQVFGDESKMGEDAKSKMPTLITRGLTIIKSSEVVDVHREESWITVTIAAQVSRQEILGILENEDISLAQNSEGSLKVYVLSYTVEGIDADRAQPIVLREEVRDIRKNVQANSSASDNTKDTKTFSDQTDASSSSSQAAIDYRDKASEKGDASYTSKGHLKASASEEAKVDASYDGKAKATAAYGSNRESALAEAAVSESGKVKGSYEAKAEIEADHDDQGQASYSADSATSLKASESEAQAKFTRDVQAESNFSRDKNAESHFSDTSSDYYSLKVYADPTKRGGGETNEVRALLEGMFRTYGLNTQTLDVQLMNQDFRNEDELIRVVWQTIEQEHPEVEADSFVAIALNRNTPVLLNSDRYKFTSAITYRVFRLRDGYQLLPSQSLTGESGEKSSEDLARTESTKLALIRAGTILKKDLLDGLKRYERLDAREAEMATTSYKLIIKNVPNPMKTREMEKLLDQAGLKFTRVFRAGTVTLQVELNGKTSDNVMDAIMGFVDIHCNFESMDQLQAILVLK